MNTFALALLAAVTANFDVTTGKIRPELHSSGFGPNTCSMTQQTLGEIKSMGFKAARTHDWALSNPNQRVCDWHHIFPLEDLDATKGEHYVFGPTDYLLKRTREEAGLEVFYRLGTSIEHSGSKVHFNSLIPKDFEKTAEVFAGTVRHYNRGWANGFNWNIRYWEIWNEPDGCNNMWCLPEGDEDWEAVTPEQKEKQAKRRDLFVKFFVTCLKRLKGEFGDTIKVGGPAMCGFGANPKHDQVDYFRRILLACRDAGVAPDFISWHHYTSDPMTLSRTAAQARALCEGLGFPKCELICNEWHYFDDDLYSWGDMQRCSDPKVKARIWEGPDSHNGIRSSCFTLATLANIQRSKLDQSYYYGCGHFGSWSYKDIDHKKFKVYYALRLFGDLVRDYTEICESSSEGTVTTFAARNAAGKKALLVIDYGGSGTRLAVDVKGVPADAKPSCKALSYQLDAEPYERFSFANGRLVLRKPDHFSAAFHVEF